MTWRKLGFWLLLGAALLGVAAYQFQAPLSLVVARQVVVGWLAADALADLPDGLHLGLCGAGSAFSDEKRAGPCTLVAAGKRLFVFDAGNASVRNIRRMGFDPGQIEAIFLTHFHADHIDGLGELLVQRWLSAGQPAPVAVHGPLGVTGVLAGLMQAYAPDRAYRIAQHGEAALPAAGSGGVAKPFTLGPDWRVVLLKDADLEIVAFAVDPSPVQTAVGYRISYKGRSVVLSGDTRKSAAVQREAQGVDLLVHAALSVPLVKIAQDGAARAGRPRLQKIFADIVVYHSTPEQAAEVARDAQVGMLLLNHIVPALPLPGMEQAFLGAAPEVYHGPIRIGSDGDFVSLPAGPGGGAAAVSRRF